MVRPSVSTGERRTKFTGCVSVHWLNQLYTNNWTFFSKAVYIIKYRHIRKIYVYMSIPILNLKKILIVLGVFAFQINILARIFSKGKGKKKLKTRQKYELRWLIRINQKIR